MKIKIKGIIPSKLAKPSERYRDLFEEIALFLDCTPIQEIIVRYRQRINLRHTIKYNNFEKWEKSAIQDTLTQEEQIYLHNLDVQID